MRGHLFASIAIVSYGLFLGVLGLWVTSHGNGQSGHWIRPTNRWECFWISDPGALDFNLYHKMPTPVLALPPGPEGFLTVSQVRDFLKPFPRFKYVEYLGFAFGMGSSEGSAASGRQAVFGYRWWFECPYWALALSLAGLSIFSSRRLRQCCRNNRIKTGLCANCRYDLRASNGRCPECGKVFGE